MLKNVLIVGSSVGAAAMGTHWALQTEAAKKFTKDWKPGSREAAQAGLTAAGAVVIFALVSSF